MAKSVTVMSAWGALLAQQARFTAASLNGQASRKMPRKGFFKGPKQNTNLQVIFS